MKGGAYLTQGWEGVKNRFYRFWHSLFSTIYIVDNRPKFNSFTPSGALGYLLSALRA